MGVQKPEEEKRAEEKLNVERLAKEMAAKKKAAGEKAAREEIEDNDRSKFFRTLTPEMRARFLYEHCIVAEKKISETVHSLFIIAEHYSKPNAKEIDNLSSVSKIPMYFSSLSPEGKAELCYNLVADELSFEALPVTVESLRATKRADLGDPWSSYAGRFVKLVISYVVRTLVIFFVVYVAVLALATYILDDFFQKNPELTIVHERYLLWVSFGCLGALLHLLNHALTTTREQTFEASEERKIQPRILLGGMLGFIIPWICILLGWFTDSSVNVTNATDVAGSIPLQDLMSAQTNTVSEERPTSWAKATSIGAVIAFFGGYSVRFSIGFIERALSAVFPETKTKT